MHSIPNSAVSHGMTTADLTACAGGRQAEPTALNPISSLLASIVTDAYADATIGSGYAWVNNYNQQAQQTWYWCGPATVSETATTQANNGRLSWSNVPSQTQAASYMGTNSDVGTTATGLTNGLNNYIGWPMYGFAFYMRYDIDPTPTDSQRSLWASDIQWDVTQDAMTVASVMWEAYNGPHLVGHPNLTSDIFHIIETIGYNWNNSQIFYADSVSGASSIYWSGGVPAYSWYDNYNFVTIMGGRGYDW